MPSFTVTEPHPTVATNSFMHSGRGGAGNFFRAPETTNPAGVPTIPTAPKKSSSSSSGRLYFAGRGGAGNAQASSHSPLSFEDEYTSASHAAASAGHVGRGGAGNFHGEGPAKKSHRKSDASSNSSTHSSGFMARLSSTFTR